MNMASSMFILQNQLSKLKDKEAKLEAALALHENDSLKEAVVELMLIISDIRVIDKKLNEGISKDVLAGIDAKIKFLRSRIAIFENIETAAGRNKYNTYKERYEKLIGSKSDAGLSDKRRNLISKLRMEVDKRKKEFLEQKLDIFEMVPSLRNYL